MKGVWLELLKCCFDDDSQKEPSVFYSRFVARCLIEGIRDKALGG